MRSRLLAIGGPVAMAHLLYARVPGLTPRASSQLGHTSFIAQTQTTMIFFLAGVVLLFLACTFFFYWKTRQVEKNSRAGVYLNDELIDTLKKRGLLLDERNLDSFWNALNNLLIKQDEVVKAIKKLGRFVTEEELDQLGKQLEHHATKRDLHKLRKLLDGYPTHKQFESISEELKKQMEMYKGYQETLLKLYERVEKLEEEGSEIAGRVLEVLGEED